MADEMASVAQVKKYFGMTMAQFKAEWQALSDADKAEIRTLVLPEIS